MISENLKQLVDDIFAATPFCKELVQIKDKVLNAFEDKYNSLIEEGYTDIKALGYIMSNYGTACEAGSLAGYSEAEIKSLTSDKEIIEIKGLKKLLKKIRWNVYFAALFCACIVVNVFNLFLDSGIGRPIAILIQCCILIFILRSLKNKRSYLYSDDVAFDEESYEYLKLFFDRYTKKFLNSMFILVGGLVIYLYFVMNMVISTKLKDGELAGYVGVQTVVVAWILLFVIKNFLCRGMVQGLFQKSFKTLDKKYLWKFLVLSAVYGICALAVIFVLRSHVEVYFNLLLVAIFIYVLLCTIYNLTLRKNIVFKNIRVNKRRVIALTLVAVLFLGYQFLSMDSWILQPYVSTVSAVTPEMDDIIYDDESGVYTITTEKEDFKILQLTDVHLGGNPVSAIKDYKALTAVYALIENTQPDFVMVTGDLVFPMGIMSFSINNSTPMLQFASFMRNVGVPWAFAYGNHDTEAMAKSSTDEIDTLLKSVSYKTSRNFLYPYIQPDITGRNNQLIEIRNEDGSLNQALFVLDSNDYVDGKMNNYDYIHDDEVDWYKAQVERLNAEEGKTVSSLLFFHMPLQEYRDAYQFYEAGSNQVKYFFGENGETMIDKVCCSDYPSKLFNTAKELGSTKAMFCGHDHYNNLSVEYEGIRLTYGLSIDYLAMPGIDKDTRQRGGTLITLHEDSTYDIEQIKLTDI